MSKHAPSRRTGTKRTPAKRAPAQRSAERPVAVEAEDPRGAERPGLVLDAFHGGADLAERGSLAVVEVPLRMLAVLNLPVPSITALTAKAAGRSLTSGARHVVEALVGKHDQDARSTNGPPTDTTKG